jgi:hypothetical protein
MTPVPAKQQTPEPTPEAVLADLIPVAKTLLENQFCQAENQQQMAMRQLELQHYRDEQNARFVQESIKLEKHKFNLGFGLLAFAILVVVAFSAGLMFIIGD